MQRNGIKKLFTTPYYYFTNKKAERSVEFVQKQLKQNKEENIHIRLARILLRYQRIPLALSGISSADLFLGRGIREHVDISHSPHPPESTIGFIKNITIRIISRRGIRGPIDISYSPHPPQSTLKPMYKEYEKFYYERGIRERRDILHSQHPPESTKKKLYREGDIVNYGNFEKREKWISRVIFSPLGICMYRILLPDETSVYCHRDQKRIK